ncbi:MAG: aminotransferase class III-fold pyridoxal phosphate-dependent enzyme, partial [Bacteroidetes bacterium]|nr:aminotransferase class III-fold pyridoxal phosphate-dependent enzyme [Bacteroidota bacterium]
FNEVEDLKHITTRTAAVILETIQGGAGFISPVNDYLKAVKRKCESVGALLILDEIQPGFGRTGKWFAYQHYDCTPDILVVGKGMAGGFPVGAFISSKENMQLLSTQPKLGHITTFGGHPVIAAAAHATLDIIKSERLLQKALEKERLIREQLRHPLIKEIRGKGLMLALIFEKSEIADYLVLEGLKNELILFWLLYEKKAVRFTPPLTISEKELAIGCKKILQLLDKFVN